MIRKTDTQKGIAQIFVIAVMALMVIGIPTATKLVQQNQENRSKATSEESTDIGSTTIGSPTINVCGTPKYDQLTSTSDKDSPELLCNSGVAWKYREMGGYDCSTESCQKITNGYTWFCLTNVDPSLDLNNANNVREILGNESLTSCMVKSNIVIHSPCNNPEYGKLTETTDTDQPNLLCKVGDIINYKKSSFGYQWTCKIAEVKINCKATEKKLTPIPAAQIPATEIKVSPTSLNLKVGQGQNLTYILTPNNSTDSVKWSMSENGMVNIQQLTLRCTDSTDTRCQETPGTSHLQVTALKVGTVKIKLLTSSGKTTEATVVITKKSNDETDNNICGTVKYDVLTETSDKDNPELLCKSGQVANFSKMTPNCSDPSNSASCPPSFYSWECQYTLDSKKSVKCTSRQIIASNKKVPATSIKVTPSSLSMKVGGHKNLTYTLTPNNSTDKVKWTLLNNSYKKLVTSKIIYPKCVNGTTGAQCVTPTNRSKLEITAIKAGTLDIMLTTTSGKKTYAKLTITK